jgi:hypothetical protein
MAQFGEFVGHGIFLVVSMPAVPAGYRWAGLGSR